MLTYKVYHGQLKIALMMVLSLLLACPAMAGKIEISHTFENLSNQQRNTATNLYYFNNFKHFSFESNLEISRRNSREDIIISAGTYHAINQTLYLHLKAGLSPSPQSLPASEYALEAGWAAIAPWVLIANYKIRNYASGTTVNIYSPGFDYYFPFPAWLSARYFIADSSDGTTSHSGLIKLFYQPDKSLRAYIGFATGSEIYRDTSSSSIFGFNADTPMLGIQYKLNKHWGIKTDLSKENRNTGVVNNIVSLGSFFEW
jgi:YaiO family outer membrane protein